MRTPQEFLQAASQLSEADRVVVIESLLESLEPDPPEDQAEVDRAWQGEVRRRSQQIKDGTVDLVSWEQVQADAERLFDGVY